MSCSFRLMFVSQDDHEKTHHFSGLPYIVAVSVSNLVNCCDCVSSVGGWVLWWSKGRRHTNTVTGGGGGGGGGGDHMN